MKRFIQMIVIVLLTLLFSTVYTYAASDQSPLNTYKHPLLSKLNQMEVLLHEVKEVIMQEEEAERLKEKKEMEIRELIEREKVAVVTEIKSYQTELQKQFEMIDSHPSIETLKEYEREKNAEIEVQLDEEIAEYLTDLLLENNK